MVTSGMSAEFIRGVAKVKDRLIIMLDLDRIFSTEEREMLVQS
jgi:chemotaxis signal transduction protein